MHKWKTFCAYALAGIFAAIGNVSAGLSAPFGNSALPVNFQAKQLSQDEAQQTVTALGDVELIQGNKILRADKMVYHLDTDTVQAIGNVSLLDDDGSIHFAEYVELGTNLKNGFIQSLLSLLADGSRFTATEARREDGVKTTMTEATYTPCKVCEDDPKPLWQIKADKITHDQTTHDAKYKNARLEFMGVPFFYTPIFSHADPSVKSRSGLLRPRIGWSDNVGSYVEGGYFFSIAPDKDATMMLRPTTKKGTLLQGQWRERFKNGKIQFNSSIAQSDRREEDGRIEEDKVRGHVAGEGLFDLDQKWRAGFDITRASDRQYLRLYDINKENVLKNSVYAERFSGRNYSLIHATEFQDVRLGARPEQPSLLPAARHQMIGEPGSLFGGRWETDLSALDVQRRGDGQDMQRLSADLGWQRHTIISSGFETTFSLDGRGDAYSVQQRDLAVLNPGISEDAFILRKQVTGSAMAGYPLIRRMDKSQAIVTPQAGFSISTLADKKNKVLPNEDSLDTQLDTNNLFDPNRFTGIDRQEDGVRLNYGLKAGIHGDNGRYGKAYIGQSYRLKDDSIYPEGSGLEDNASDIVGHLSAGLSRYLNADYRFQADSRTLAVHRHEIQADAGNDIVAASAKYIYLDVIENTGFNESREQLLLDGSYRMTSRWTSFASGLLDLGEEPGFRKTSLGFQYADECFTFAAEGARNLLNEASGDSGTILMLRLGLKNIGDIRGPQISLHPGPKQQN